MLDVLDKVINIDGAIILGFLLLNLLIGIYFSRGITNIREYAIGKRNFSTAALVSTIVATWIGGESFSFGIFEVYKNGLYYFFCGIAIGLSFLVISWVFAPRMQEFLGKISIAEAMGDIYGTWVKIFTIIFGVIFSLGLAATQFAFLSILLTHFYGIYGIYIVFLCGLIVVSYSTFGGMRAVTFTDVIQFGTFIIIIPITAFLIWRSYGVGGDMILLTLENNPLFDFKSIYNYNNPRFFETILVICFCLLPGLDEPVIFQRISMARNIKQVQRSTYISGLIIIGCFLLFSFIAILLLSDQSVTNLELDSVPSYILENYLTPGFKGFFVVGILAICMSSADSYVHVITVLLAHDFTKTLGINLPQKQELFYTRIVALISGIIILSLAYYKNVLDIIVGAYSFYTPIISVPLLLAVLGFRSSSFCVLLGMLAGFMTVCYINFFAELNPIALGIAANLIVLIGSHYLLRQPGGWSGIQDDGTYLEISKKRANTMRNLFAAIKKFSILDYLEQYARKVKSNVYLGLFCSISLFFNLYSFPHNVLNDNYDVIILFAYCTLFLSSILISYPAWYPKFKNPSFISSVIHLAIFNILVSCSYFVLINNFAHLQIINFSITLVIISILLSWHIAVPFMILGVVLAVQFYKYFTGLDIEFDSISIELSVFYVMIMVSLICIVLIKPKEEALTILETKSNNLWQKVNDMDNEVRSAVNIKTEFISNISHEVRTPMTGIISLSQALCDNYDKIPESKKRECVNAIAKSSERLISLMNNILDFSTLTNFTMKLHLKKTNITEIVYECLKRCKKLYLEDKELNFNLDIENELYINCDAYHISHTIDNLIINAICYSKEETTVKIILKQKEGSIYFSIRDEGIGIPKEELEKIFTPFTTSTKTHNMAGGRGIGLALSYAAIKAHKGRIWAKSDGLNWAEFVFEI